MTQILSPRLVAITGGSGAGKSWLAERLGNFFGADAARLSLDSFYRDRSHLPEKRREQLNYDHPRAIDWEALESCLRECRAGRCASVPVYDFKTHSRASAPGTLASKPLVIVEGLWLLRPASVRRLFDLAIFIDCPERLRLSRRMERDVGERGRTAASIRTQFRETVAPMHRRYIASQIRYADIVLKQPLTEKVAVKLADELRRILAMGAEDRPGTEAQHGIRIMAKVPEKNQT